MQVSWEERESTCNECSNRRVGWKSLDLLSCLPNPRLPYSAGAASSRNGDHRSQGHFTVADEDDQQVVHTPPRWRRISAATASAPPQQEYPTSPSIRRQGKNGRQWHGNPQRDEGSRAPTEEDVEYSPNGYHGGGVPRYGGDQRAAREPGWGGEYEDHPDQPARDCPWRGR